MSREHYIDYINNPNLLGSNSLEHIRMLIDEFPYFQSAWLLYAKNLKSVNDIRYDSQLKQAAIRVADRSVLFGFVNSQTVEKQNTEEKIFDKEKNLEDIVNSRLSEIQSKESAREVNEKKNDSLIEIVELLDFAFEIELDFSDGSEKFSNNELDVLINSELQGSYQIEALNTTGEEKRTRKIELVDKFIESESPGLSRETEMAISNPLPEYKVESSDDLISDTLARIYIRQGYFEKALSTYEKLSLKYPEKNIYFAAQIEMIKDLIKKTT